jgi:hypothetical protein
LSFLGDLGKGFRAELSRFGAFNLGGCALGVAVITGSHFGDEIYNVFIAAIDGGWHQSFPLVQIAAPTPWIDTILAFFAAWLPCFILGGLADVRLRK